MTIQSSFGGSQRKSKANQDNACPHGGLSFWESASLEDLIRTQGVEVVDSLDEISALWPEEDDPDELLRFLNEERRIRRGLQGDRSADR